jgi:hypothetical protein
MSTTWATLEIRDARKQTFNQGLRRRETDEYVEELEKRNQALEKENQEIKACLKQQHRMRFKKNKKPVHTPADSAPRKRGAPVGHPGWYRKTPARIDQTVHVNAPSCCPHCDREHLKPSGDAHTHIQEDIVLQPRTVITEYIHQTAYCPSCRRNVFQTAQGELRNSSIGPTTKAVAVYLRHKLKLSYRDVREIFSTLFGMPFVPASAMAFSKQSAAAGAGLYADLNRKVRAAAIIHGDETHWRIDGQSAYLWYAGNRSFDFFHADFSRGSQVAVDIFGEAFNGHLNADSYAAYNAIHPKSRQACLAHLKRKADEIAERIRLIPEEKQDQQSLHFCRALSKFISHCCKLGRKRNNGTLSVKKARSFIPQLEKMRNEICLLKLRDEAAENLRNRITDPNRDAQRLFVFLEINGVEPTNNHAEQALRLPVIFRKICFGNRSLEGARDLAVNLSLLGTAQRQNRDPIDLFRTLLLNSENTPLEKLYDPENLPKINSS